MKKLTVVCGLIALCCSFSYAASMQSLNKNQVMKTLEDKTITTVPLVTLHGNLVTNTATVYFGKKGEVVGEFENKPENDPQSDQGTWQAKADGQICVTWKAWTKDKPTCVYTYKLANGLVFVNTANKFESMVLTNGIQSGNRVHS